MSVSDSTDRPLAGSGSRLHRDWIAGRGFMRLHFDLIDALGGSWEAAALIDRIAYRAGEDGWWTATLADLGAELRLTEWKVKRAVQQCRDAGMVTSERVSSFDPTLRWRLVYGDDAEGGNRPPVQEETSSTVTEDSAVTSVPREPREQPPAEVSAAPGPILALVASGDVAEPALFASPEVENRATLPPEASANGCRQAWLAAYAERHGAPDPTIKRRAFGKIRDAARDRGDDLEAWRRLWTACSEAGHAGRWDVSAHLAPAPAARYPQRTSNPYVALADAAATAGVLDGLLAARPAT